MQLPEHALPRLAQSLHLHTHELNNEKAGNSVNRSRNLLHAIFFLFFPPASLRIKMGLGLESLDI